MWRWRNALGVNRTNNEGSARLIRAAAQKGAEAVAAREWTEQDRKLKRRLNAELGQSKHLITGYHGPWWTPEDTALLGVLTDQEIARRTRRTVNAVRQRREQLGIANPLDGRRGPRVGQRGV